MKIKRLLRQILFQRQQAKREKLRQKRWNRFLKAGGYRIKKEKEAAYLEAGGGIR